MNNNINSKVVLDASALLALILEEQGAEVIKPLLKLSVMSVVNIAEILCKLQRPNISPKEGLALITDIVPNIVPFDLEDAEQVAELKPSVQSKGLSLADCACITLGIKLKAPIYTTDKIWSKLNLDCKIVLIR